VRGLVRLDLHRGEPAAAVDLEREAMDQYREVEV
jgi:hypothetical protein